MKPDVHPRDLTPGTTDKEVTLSATEPNTDPVYRGDGRPARYAEELKRMRLVLKKRFTYHAPTPDQPERYERIRREARFLAQLVVGDCPPSRETSLALTKIEEAAFWANAAIARNETPMPAADVAPDSPGITVEVPGLDVSPDRLEVEIEPGSDGKANWDQGLEIRNLNNLDLIEELRSKECDSVTLLADNPSFDGPNCKILVSSLDFSSDLEDLEFTGETFRKCLEDAVAAKRQANSIEAKGARNAKMIQELGLKESVRNAVQLEGKPYRAPWQKTQDKLRDMTVRLLGALTGTAGYSPNSDPCWCGLSLSANVLHTKNCQFARASWKEGHDLLGLAFPPITGALTGRPPTSAPGLLKAYGRKMSVTLDPTPGADPGPSSPEGEAKQAASPWPARDLIEARALLADIHTNVATPGPDPAWKLSVVHDLCAQFFGEGGE